MIKGRQVLYLFLGICLFLIAYLPYVAEQRKQSIVKYFAQPKVGDIYKIKRDEDDGDSRVHYLKISHLTEDSIEFKTSKFMSEASADYLLNHYDPTSSVKYSIQDLQAIKDGKWKNWQKNNTSLIEVIRKN
jgi:hypothetical protein